MLRRLVQLSSCLLLGFACYQPLEIDDLCHPTDPDCADADFDGDGLSNSEDNCPRKANPSQQDEDDDGIGDVCDPCPDRGCGPGCGECPGITDWCNEDGVCVDDCEGLECGPSPNAGHDCGSCEGGTYYCTAGGSCVDDCIGRECGLSPNAGLDCGSCLEQNETCSSEGICVCAVEECGDGYCRSAEECCEAEDCGQGYWSCIDHVCNCETGACPDSYCPGTGECCGSGYDDQCGPTGICQGNICFEGPDGELVVNGPSCTLDGVACPTEVFYNDGSTWVLTSESLLFTNVMITGSATLTAPAVDAMGDRGRLKIFATGTINVDVGARVTMSGRGHGGGGGGGGRQYCDTTPPEVPSICNFGAGGGVAYEDANGQPGEGSVIEGGPVPQCLSGYASTTVGSGSGGSGGGFDGSPGSNGFGCPVGYCQDQGYPLEPGDGSGGAGGGVFGGAGGTGHGYANKCMNNAYCDDVEGPGGAPAREAGQPAEAGMPGGYAAPGCNGDTSEDESVIIGSGGGGGAGGDKGSGYCCGAADGGKGGVPGGEGFVGCTGGGGGGGGAAGGGIIEIRARDLVVSGEITADGAGHADLGGGFGAGGGILLYIRQSYTSNGGLVRTLGGIGDGTGTRVNGGTIKLFYRTLLSSPPQDAFAGRVYMRDLSD